MKETELKIRLFEDTILRTSAQPVKEITEYHRGILSGMARLMYETSGLGLAAPQIGISASMIVVDAAGSGLYKLLNPKIIRQEGQFVMEEGCLSLPGVAVKVKRAKKIIVEAQDDLGKQVFIETEDLLACVFQHEVDHLNGILIIDHASLAEKAMIKKKLEGIKNI